PKRSKCARPADAGEPDEEVDSSDSSNLTETTSEITQREDVPHPTRTIAAHIWTTALASHALPNRDPLNRLAPVSLVDGMLTLRAVNSFYRDQAREKWSGTIVQG